MSKSKQARAEILSAINNGNLSLWCVNQTVVPKDLKNNTAGRVEFWMRNFFEDNHPSFGTLKRFEKLGDIFRATGDIFFLDNEAINVLMAKYPNRAKFVLVRLSIKKEWLLGIPGLIRRILNGSVSYVGIYRFETAHKKSSWIVLRNNTVQSRSPVHFTFSKDIGLKNLFLKLNSEGINYVIPRFFENLPELHREDGGDLDILVSDSDADKLRNILELNPGEIPVDVHVVSEPTSGSGLPYYPPALGKKMLENKLAHNSGAYVVSKDEYLLSFIYHVLYHKGMAAGIASLHQDLKPHNRPDNDYAGKIKELSSELDIPLHLTMEDLDDYLYSRGWRPKIDTLDLLKNSNQWVWRNFFYGDTTEEIGLSVIILKKIVDQRDNLNLILDDISKEGFKIIRSIKLEEAELEFAKQHLRGGNWYSPESPDLYLPSYFIILFDMKSSGAFLTSPGSRLGRIRILKKKLRKKYDITNSSMIHATDDTHQSWEYIYDCFPALAEKVREELSVFVKNKKASIRFPHTLKMGLISFYRRNLLILKQYIGKKIGDIN